MKLIPEFIDPYRFAELGVQLKGEVSVKNMKRLVSNLVDQTSVVDVSMVFGRDEQQTTFLTGQLAVKLSLQCQRCLDAYAHDIKVDFSLGVVTTLDEANNLPTNYEPVLVKDGQLALHELIEDEVILNLPIIPRHEIADCKVQTIADFEIPGKEPENKSPFEVLKNLKDK